MLRSVGLQVLHDPHVLQTHVSCLAEGLGRAANWKTILICRSTGLKEQLYVKILFAYSLIGFIIVEVFFFGIWCRPFMNYFRVFEENDRE